MPLFQNSIVNKYLNNQNKILVLEQWTAFQNHFHNPNIQENIRKSKEEQYQEGFLRDLFVNILGYKLNPDADFNLTTELKNVKDSKKADGAIIINNIAKAVVELKGTNTTDLSKIETQAFSYKNNQKDCVYVITSNFEKLRFYIDNAIEYIEFNLFQLTFKEFELLFLCLAYSNIFNDIPKKVKEESINQEDVITKKLYKDYSLFKQELYQNLVDLNPQYDKVDLYKKSQKLLDRFLFVFFAEDRQLLPAYSVRSILKQWKLFKDWDDYRPLYDHYKTYFGFLVKGIKNETLDIFAYNGGLFENDVILDSIKIDDKLLYDHTLKISEYNFLSDVDVNILGHIFENSLNQLDELKAQNSDAAVEKTVSKRKKDGVFYTPKYITKYIVNNTVGKLCADKKESFQIIESEFFIDKKRTNDSKKTLLNKLTEYRNWLLQITIIDPACGSGAFLNEALNFLIEEHQYIDELQAKLFGDGLILSDVEMSILENNLFGVDLNEESAEIAKLSLWLRTARPNRKLNNLNNNIKCGNSLIDDPAIAGEKAFNWQNEFPKIFEKGGFDVVIGNPPYVVLPPISFNAYDYTIGNNNTYVAFTELGLKISNNKGQLGLIIPNTWFGGDSFLKFRNFLIIKNNLSELIQLPYDIFEAHVDTSIVLIDKKTPTPYTKYYKYDIKNYQSDIEFENLLSFPKLEWIKYGKIFLNTDLLKVGEKVWFSNKNILLGDISKINRGCLPPKDDEKSNTKSSFYNIKWFDNQVFRYVEELSNEVFVNYENLKENKKIEIYNGKKIFVRQLMSRQFRMNASIIDYDCAFKKNIYTIYNINEDFSYEYILSLLNSKLFSFTQVNFNTSLQRDDFPAFSLNDFKNFNIPITPLSNQQPFIEKANLMLSLNKDLQDVSQKVQRNIQREFQINDLPKKLQDWYLLSYSDFLKELEKKKVKLSLSQKSEWESYFETESQKANNIKQQIETTDKQIDAMVYQLYGLTQDEIEIVEKG